MEYKAVRDLIHQALFMSNNYIQTGRISKALETLTQIKKIFPDSTGESFGVGMMLRTVDIMLKAIAFNAPYNLELLFGKNWNGESLDNKTILVICDQGMGDTLNCLRYLKAMHDKWNCTILLNCHAFHEEFKLLMGFVDYVQLIEVAEHCDFNTNILSVPAILNGLKFEVNYPAHWQEFLDTEIPPQPELNVTSKKWHEDSFRVGLAWRSNLENPIGVKKSIHIQHFAMLEDGVNELWSIIPSSGKYNMLIQPALNNLLDTAILISSLDVVVTVDTVTLHLAGMLNKKTLALLPFEADARWGLGDKCVWYPSVELFRQPKNLDWEVPMKQVKERLESLRSLD
jgi:hypothetical protein